MAQNFLAPLICQSLADRVHQLAGVPLSGPIIGMVLLLVLMRACGEPSTHGEKIDRGPAIAADAARLIAWPQGTVKKLTQRMRRVARELTSFRVRSRPIVPAPRKNRTFGISATDRWLGGRRISS